MKRVPRKIKVPANQIELPFFAPRAPRIEESEIQSREVRLSGLALKEEALKIAAGRPVVIQYNNNRSQMISMKRHLDGTMHVRISRVMKIASVESWKELGLWIKNPGKNNIFTKGTHSGEFIRSPKAELVLSKTKVKREKPIKSLGRNFDLKTIFSNLNSLYFGGKCDAKIGWSRKPISKARHSIQLGAYYEEDNTILINPVLDWEQVPLMVLEGTMFHEMIHWQLRFRQHEGKRRKLHDVEFKSQMEMWPKNAKYEKWLAKNAAMLIRRRNYLSRKKKLET